MSNNTIESLLEPSRISCATSLSSKKKSLQLVAQLIEGSLDINEDDDEGVDMDVMDALAARERLGCTGMGHGIAIPHGRVDFISEPIGALLTLSEAIPFDAPDDVPVDIVFGLLMPEDANEEHLNILASLARFFKSPENRDAIRRSANAEEILQTLIERGMNKDDTVSDDTAMEQPGRHNESKQTNGSTHPDC